MWTEPPFQKIISRRQALSTFAHGFGMAALAGLFANEAAAGAATNPLAPRAGHHPARAKRAIFLFMAGGPSQVDTFDPKPKLTEMHGKEIPIKLPAHMRDASRKIVGTPFTFAPHGKSGLPISELFPGLARHADDLCVIRSMKADNIDHFSASLQMATGEQMGSRPSLGSWLMYGLGSENQNLPGFVVLSPRPQPFAYAEMGSASFLPASYEGTLIADLANPLANVKHPRLAPADQRRRLDVLQQLNALHRAGREDDTRLDARIAAFETAFRMQAEAPEAFNLSGETELTRRLYGLDEKLTQSYGTQCLMARRLIERGVRFVHVNHHSKAQGQDKWDQHGDLEKHHRANAAEVDTPIAGLLADLKARDLLKDTLVIWGGEFGRSPTGQGKNGREHHPHGFSMWLAGGGVKGGHIHGATDEFGWYATENTVHIPDFHATLLHLMGLDHERLTWRHGGRDYRLTDVSGDVVKSIFT